MINPLRQAALAALVLNFGFFFEFAVARAIGAKKNCQAGPLHF